MSWAQGPLLALDFETTGIDAHTCRVVQVGLCLIRPGDGAQQRLWLLNPGVDIPQQASRIHGITTERARNEGERPAQVLTTVRDTIVAHLQQGWPLIAFNASYDCTLLEAELARLNLPTVSEQLGGPLSPVIDPFVLDKHLSRRKGSRKLADQCVFYEVRIDGAHDAGHDAMAAARLAWRIAQRHPEIAAMSLLELHHRQVEWAREQADSLRAYFERVGKQHDGVDGTWPVRQPTAVPA